jgi:sec-independent protein translocase protein TatA
MFRSFGPVEIGIVLVIILIIFGVGKLPSVGGAIGKGIHEFRKASRGDYDEEKEKEAKPVEKTEAKAEDKAVKS